MAIKMNGIIIDIGVVNTSKSGSQMIKISFKMQLYNDFKWTSEGLFKRSRVVSIFLFSIEGPKNGETRGLMI